MLTNQMQPLGEWLHLAVNMLLWRLQPLCFRNDKTI